MSRRRAVDGGAWQGSGSYLRVYPGLHGARPRLASALLPNEVTIRRDQVRVRGRWTRETWVLERSGVALVGRTAVRIGPAFGSRGTRPRAIVFLLEGGGVWNIQVTPVALQDVLAELGWPVDPEAVLDWANVVETAVPTHPAVPSWFAPERSVAPPR